MNEIRLMALNGFLGYGYGLESLKNGIRKRPDFMGVDAGSVDPGPYYLGSGNQLVRPAQVFRDLQHALPLVLEHRIPFIVGSAGTAGGEPHLTGFLEVLRRVAEAAGLRFRMALIRSEIPKQIVLQALREGRIEAMKGAPLLSEAAVESTVRCVGQMGTGPFARALSGKAQVVVAGRACDTAVFAAPAIMRGFDPGLAFHMAKILECGALCAVPAGANDCMFATLREDHFLIQSLNPRRRVTSMSVAAHSLYEQSDPIRFVEPEGTVDIAAAEYRQVDEHTVRVSGTRFLPSRDGVTIKLEGAALKGYRTIAIAGVRDPKVIANLDVIEEAVRRSVAENAGSELTEAGYELGFRYYGRDAVLGSAEPLRDQLGHEIGVLIEAVAPTQDASSAILALARSSFLHCHFDGRVTTAGNAAFAFSPSDVQTGPVYDFSIYHVLSGESVSRLFPVEHVEFGAHDGAAV